MPKFYSLDKDCFDLKALSLHASLSVPFFFLCDYVFQINKNKLFSKNQLNEIMETAY